MSELLKCEACGSILPMEGERVPSHWPAFDLRHSICADAYWAMVKAAKDPVIVVQFLSSRPSCAGQLSRARAWGELDPGSRFEFETWLIEKLRVQRSCGEVAA